MRKVRIIAGKVTAEAELYDTPTAQAVWEALPFESTANLWGEEVYFEIPVEAELIDAKEVVEPGDIGYWPPGKAFCIFFGPTPISRPGEIRPASPVNVFGRILGDPSVFKEVRAGTKIRVEKA